VTAARVARVQVGAALGGGAPVATERSGCIGSPQQAGSHGRLLLLRNSSSSSGSGGGSRDGDNTAPLHNNQQAKSAACLLARQP